MTTQRTWYLTMLSVTLVLFFLCGGSNVYGAPPNGLYVGTTDQGRDIEVRVSGGKIDWWKASLYASCDYGTFNGTVETTFDPPCEIETDGSFFCGNADCGSMGSSGQEFWGQFYPDNTVSGTIKVGHKYYGSGGGYVCCSSYPGFSASLSEDSCAQDLDNGVVCLRDGRFELIGTWTDFANPAVTLPLIWTPVENINATAGFQNNPSGIQIVMRVADGCFLTGTWWVWLGGFTDAGWDIAVRDTVTGDTRTFSRTRQGGSFPTTTRDMTTFRCD